MEEVRRGRSEKGRSEKSGGGIRTARLITTITATSMCGKKWKEEDLEKWGREKKWREGITAASTYGKK